MNASTSARRYGRELVVFPRCTCFTLIFLLGLPLVAASFPHPGGTQTQSQIVLARNAILDGQEPWASAYADILEFAQSGLAEAPSPIAVFNPPGADDPAYTSLLKETLDADANAAYYCALVYRLDIGLPLQLRNYYAYKATVILDAWASTNQVISGGTTYADQGKLFMAYIGSKMVVAADLIYDYQHWNPVDRNEFLAWTAFVFRPAVLDIADGDNNKAAWGLFAATTASHLLDDEVSMLQHEERLREMIDEQIASDGSLPKELARGSKSLWYTYFALAPLTHATEIIRNDLGIDHFEYQPPSGGTIEQALEYFLTGFQDPAGWSDTPQELIPSGSGDWGANLLSAMGHIYDNSSFLAVTSAPLDRRNAAWQEADLLVPFTLSAPLPAVLPLVLGLCIPLVARKRLARR